MGILLIALSLIGLEGPHPIEKKYLHNASATAQLQQDTPHLFVRHAKRAYGTTKTVRILTETAAAFARIHPDSPKIRVGDMSWAGGGRMPPHLSHQDGRDADIGYFRHEPVTRDPFFKPTNARTLDVPLTWTLIRLLLDTEQVEYIFMDYTLQRALYQHAIKKGATPEVLKPIFQYPRPSWERVGIIRWVKGHHTHFHIRFLSANRALKELGQRLIGVKTPARTL